MRFCGSSIQKLTIIFLLVASACLGGMVSLSETDYSGDYFLLHHFNDVSTLTCDVLPSYTVSVAYNEVTSTTSPKYGNACLYSEPTGVSGQESKLTLSGFSSSSDITVSFWYKKTSDSSRGFVYRGGNFNLSAGYGGVATDMRITEATSGGHHSGAGLITSVGAIDTWYFIQLVRSGTTAYVFIDGDLKGTYSIGTNTDTTSVQIGGYLYYYDPYPTEYYSDTSFYIDELRITETAEHTATFTVDEKEYPVLVKGKISLSTDGIISLADTAGTPPVSGYVAWYDASDESTITSSGGAVSVWADKSGNGYDAVYHSTKPTTASDSLNGLNVISFNNDYMTIATETIPAGNSSYTICAVWYSSADNQALIHLGDETSNEAVGVHTTSGRLVRHYWWNNDLNSTTAYTSNQMLVVSYDGASRILRVNETEYSDSPTSKNTGTTYATIGGITGLSYSLYSGYIAEIIIYHTALSATEITSVESYLKNKWGL